MRNVVRSFTRDGKRYFIPNNSAWAWRTLPERFNAHQAGRAEWSELRRRILARWQPSPEFKTFAHTGHIAALRPHLSHKWFAVIDLLDFYDHVTRTKVYRSLENIGFGRPEAFRLAGDATVRQGHKVSLARGFRQSSMLAALALEQSLFGSYLRRRTSRSTITVFSDDIIISSEDCDELQEEFLKLLEVLERSNFPVHPRKTQFPRSEAQVFNMKVSHGTLRFTDERMWKFLTAANEIFDDTQKRNVALFEKLFGNYIASVNVEQARLLRSSVGFHGG
jgi:hypothetical protein